jgi:hypothetical protein
MVDLTAIYGNSRLVGNDRADPMKPPKDYNPYYPDVDIPFPVVEPPPGLEGELADLVFRMITARPARSRKIRDAGNRLRRAFLGPVSNREQTKNAQERRRARLDRDDVEIMEILLDLVSTNFPLSPRGIAGKIRKVMLEQRKEGLNRHRAVPLVKTIRDKLKRIEERADRERLADREEK